MSHKAPECALKMSAASADTRSPPPDATALTSRILTEGRMLDDKMEFVRWLGRALVKFGLPVTRLFFGLRELHPLLYGRALVWSRPDDRVIEAKRLHGIEVTAYYHGNPVSVIFERGESLRRRLVPRPSADDFPILRRFHDEGMTDYAAYPLRLAVGGNQAVALMTERPVGFTDGDLALFEGLLPAIASVVEGLVARRQTRDVLATYIGKRAAKRVIRGSIKRGECHSIEAALCFADLQDFTALTLRLRPDQVVALLDQYLEAVVTPVLDHGGEVLKFIGDGVLAAFPAGSSDADRAAVCKRAVEAATAAISGVGAVTVPVEAGIERLCCGIAIHYGTAAYGNVGAPTRLDFTVIGPAVNLVARLEELTRLLDDKLIVSDAAASMLEGAVFPLGAFALKGIPESQPIYGMRRQGRPAASALLATNPHRSCH